MGCFDTVHFLCPNCGAEVSEQSKAGDCALADYWLHRIPTEIALDLQRHGVDCPKCRHHCKFVGAERYSSLIVVRAIDDTVDSELL